MKVAQLISVIILSIQTIACQNNKPINPDSDMLFDRIPRSEYNTNMTYYTDKALPGSSLEEMLRNTTNEMIAFIDAIPEDKIDYAYGSFKWTVGEVLQHIISYEEIMLEVALLNAGVISEKEHTVYYNQNTTIAGAKGKSKSDLLAEFKRVRQKTENAFNSLTDEQQKRMGTLDGNKTSVRVIAFCISGHQTHHFNVIRELYLD
ncbi:DinB family protein [Winogradskyella maritima]|uniref:DinB family protein n=1 Tax=Winogradskyella maritima TaxID=1517766 RepID=A0ABV8AGC1_9FLAO|nr:DinB family protein [Winogradskyella maritima]